jgi:hypothetical protein
MYVESVIMVLINLRTMDKLENCIGKNNESSFADSESD